MEFIGLLCVIVPCVISFGAGYAWCLYKHGWLGVRVGPQPPATEEKAP